MIRDRGNKKWVSMMLPEHVKLLRDFNEEHAKVNKPQLDEQEFEQIGFTIMESLRYTLQIKLTIWQNGYLKHYIGIVEKLDHINKSLFLESDEEHIHIQIEDITAIERV